MAFLSYLNEDGTEVSFVRVFPDAEVMGRHLEGANEGTKDTYEFLKPVDFEIYGRPSDQALQVLRRAAEAGHALTTKSEPLAEYIRLSSA